MTSMGLEILRDSEFKSLGLLIHEQDEMLVMFYDEAYLQQLLANPAISAVVTTRELAERLPDRLGIGVCPDPLQMFYRIHEHLLRNTDFYGKPFDTVIDPTARVSERAYVAPQNVRIGVRCVIHPGAIILEGSILDEDVIVRSGTVIGGEGFEPKAAGGRHFIVPHAGGVHLSRGVEVLSSSHIAKSVFGGHTKVGYSTKIDVQVHISHNVKIGADCEIAAGAIIGGSTTIGDKVWIGLNATISAGLSVGDQAFIVMGAVVAMNVASGATAMGNPARLVRHGKGNLLETTPSPQV